MSTKKFPIYLVVQNVRSLYNVGSIFRCADVFGVDKIFLCGYTGFPPRKEISKTALGAETWIAWERQYQTHLVIKKLKQSGFQILALETGDNHLSLSKVKLAAPTALVVGSEVNGISPAILALADKKVVIPMHGKKESLNVAVATGIALYQLRN